MPMRLIASGAHIEILKIHEAFETTVQSRSGYVATGKDLSYVRV